MRVATVALYAVLLAVSVVVFRAFDASSHSASDTLRPFILTMAPLWAVAIVVSRWVSAR